MMLLPYIPMNIIFYLEYFAKIEPFTSLYAENIIKCTVHYPSMLQTIAIFISNTNMMTECHILHASDIRISSVVILMSTYQLHVIFL